MNADLPTDLWRPLRYRLSLRLRDPLTAARLRRDPGVTDRERDDFRTTAGLHLLWAGRYDRGFPLYASRHNAILFPRTVPGRLTHAPLPEDPSKDEDTIILEQGLGDVLFHLAHIRAEGRHEASHFVGLRKYGTLIRRYFPKARFTAHDDLPGGSPRPRAHLAADFVGRGYRRTGRVAAPVQFDTPFRRTGEPPVWGICWRGGSGQNRREERHIPLRMFLDLLPRDGRFLALQFDMTDEERAVLQGDFRRLGQLAHGGAVRRADPGDHEPHRALVLGAGGTGGKRLSLRDHGAQGGFARRSRRRLDAGHAQGLGRPRGGGTRPHARAAPQAGAGDGAAAIGHFDDDADAA